MYSKNSIEKIDHNFVLHVLNRYAPFDSILVNVDSTDLVHSPVLDFVFFALIARFDAVVDDSFFSLSLSLNNVV